jgi:hypothetical protein
MTQSVPHENGVHRITDPMRSRTAGGRLASEGLLYAPAGQ